jgi:hypothetical protein
MIFVRASGSVMELTGLAHDSCLISVNRKARFASLVRFDDDGESLTC